MTIKKQKFSQTEARKAAMIAAGNDNIRNVANMLDEGDEDILF